MKYNQEEFCFLYKNIVLNAHQGRCEDPSTTLRNPSVCSPLTRSPNIAYTAYSIRPNFSYAETSYMLGTLSEIGT